MELLHLSDLVNPSDPSFQTVKEALKDKHPTAHTAPPEALIQGEPPDINPVIFYAIDASAIRSCALCTKGAAGPSGLDPVPGEDYVLLTSLLPMPYVNHCHSVLNIYAQSILTHPVGSSP